MFTGRLIVDESLMMNWQLVDDEFVGCLTVEASQFGFRNVHRETNGRREFDDDLAGSFMVDASKVGSRKVHGETVDQIG